MKNKRRETKEQIVIFRAPRSVVKSIDRLAKLIGGNRSEALRRLIPDLSSTKGAANRVNNTESNF